MLFQRLPIIFAPAPGMTAMARAPCLAHQSMKLPFLTRVSNSVRMACTRSAVVDSNRSPAGTWPDAVLDLLGQAGEYSGPAHALGRVVVGKRKAAMGNVEYLFGDRPVFLVDHAQQACEAHRAERVAKLEEHVGI